MKQETLTLQSRLQVNKLEDRFDIIRVLGQGTAGTVYHVKDRLRDNKDFALKILCSNLAYNKESLLRFIEELKISSKINHKNIIQAYELVECKNCIGYTMELVNGCDLKQLMSHSRFTYEEIDQVMFQLLEGLSELHRLKILHRDIKLENIILSESGVVKISDLGLIKKCERKTSSHSGTLLGTPQYMAPEYIKSEWYDERSDIYSCGIVLYELLTGKRRLNIKDGTASIKFLLSTKFEIPEIRLPRNQSIYYDILNLSLAVSPDSRFQSAKEMQQAFTKSDPYYSKTMTSKINKTNSIRRNRPKKRILRYIILLAALLLELLRPALG